jgi:DNA-binding PadR family transcriptional regulator
MRQLSELEGAVLGIVLIDGPCTAYAVRTNFSTSPSPHWSGSAGAIYPLIRRLQTRGLLISKPQQPPGRRGRLYQLTAKGRNALQRWLEPPLPDWVVGVPVDSLRTRVRFLEILSPAQRVGFLDEAQAKLRVHLQEVQQDCRRTRDLAEPYEYLVARGALAILKARTTWLEEIRRSVETRRPSDG